MDFKRAQETTRAAFRDSIVPRLSDYIRIPNKSPLFDADWQAHGHMDRAAELMAAWCREQPIAGLKVEIDAREGRTPVLLCEIPGAGSDTVLLYGHMDKQPEFTGWADGLSPWEPVIPRRQALRPRRRGRRLRGFLVLDRDPPPAGQKIPHARSCRADRSLRESGSYDLPFYVDKLATRIGTPSLVVCLDAECGNYDQLWCTTSLRGNLVGDLVVEGLTEGVHSGAGTGIAPSVFRIARTLLSRVENDVTGDVLLDEFIVPIPPARIDQARAAASVLGTEIAGKLPFVPGARALTDSPVELVLNNTWRPSLAVTGASGLPAMENAGNVLLPRVEFKLSFRMPPSANAEDAAAAVKKR
jgi:acetylornithine deacetylase/succinyl-diaminopimelate desuccinylase-like protein